MIYLRSVDDDAYNWVEKVVSKYWTRSYQCEIIKCGMLLNNHCKSFNPTFLYARDKTIITILEKIECTLLIKYTLKENNVRGGSITMDLKL